MSLRVALLASVILFGSATAVVVAVHLINVSPSSNPFADLARLMPGQPLSGVGDQYAYVCDSYEPMLSQNGFCRVDSPPVGFTNLTFYVRDSRIDRLNIEGSNVSVGDMAIRWGTHYRIQRLGHVRYIRWDKGQYATVPAGVPFRFFLPVKTLSFTQASLP